MTCPNTNLDSWKNLVAARGEDIAYYLWDKYDGDVPESESKSEIVKAGLKSINALQSDKAIQLFNTLTKNKVMGSAFWNKIQTDLQIPKEQLELLKSFNTTDRNELITNMLANYSYTVEINTAKENHTDKGNDSTEHINLSVPGGTNYKINVFKTPLIVPSIIIHFFHKNQIGWFRSDEQIKYTGVKKIQDGLDDNNNPLFINEDGSLDVPSDIKTRRILEVQSDLFQKGRESKVLTSNPAKQKEWNYFTSSDGKKYSILYKEDENGEIRFRFYDGSSTNLIDKKDLPQDVQDFAQKERLRLDNLKTNSDNKFLQLLNKDNNWVTFFIKSIIQDSAKKGYEKVLFPTGNTASKVEGHTTLEEFKKQKEDRIKELETSSILKNKTVDGFYYIQRYLEDENGNEVLTWRKVSNETGREKTATTEEINQLKERFSDETKNEINQLKQELERVETEGFGALKPIYNFYENTVTNILKKQGYNPVLITDEYGNTWNEIEVVPEREQQSILLQTDEMPASKASESTLNKVKEAAKKMGISIQNLADYIKGNPNVSGKSINGLADIVKKIIAVATGREDVALTEEMVHIATAMLEQTRPDIITKMISKIDRFKIYKKVLETYGKRKEYQLANGKPDIRKIKKEAVDKLIVELIIRDAQDVTDFPELLEEEPRNFVQKLWESIKDVIRMMYSSANINIFEEAATKIMAGELNVEEFEKAKSEGLIKDDVFLQIETNDIVNNTYDNIINEHNKMKLIPAEMDSTGKVIKKRHYTYDGQEVAKSVTEKIKEDVKMPERTGLLKEQDEQKRAWGDEGHVYIKNFITANLIDENGYARTTPLDNKIATNLNDDVREKLDVFAKELINSYPKGTRFIIEKMVVNKKVKGMMGSTIDFMAIEPITKADGTKDAKIDILDWKFTNINKSVADDIPWYKQKEWKAQMGEYTKIMYNYGVKSTQLRKTRMVPFQANYLYAIPGDPKSGLVLTSIEIGKLDTIDENNLYLLPVPLNTESTGNKRIDEFLESLRRWHEKLYKTIVSEEEKIKKNIQLNQISTAIRKLHLQLDFAPLASVGKTFLENAKETLASFENIDYSRFSKEELRKKLGDLLEYQKSAEKFSNLDDVFLAYVSKENMTEEDKKVLDSLEKISASTERMIDRIIAVQREFVVQLALKEKFTTETTKESILNAEKEIDGFSKSFLEASKLPLKIVNLAANLLMNAKSLVERRISRLIDEYSKVLLPVEQEAKSKGVSAFDLVGRVENGNIHLIKKIDPKFYKAYNDAIAKKDKSFFLDNLDVDKYNTLMEEFLNKSIDTINQTEFSPIENEDLARKKFEIEKIKNSVDINSSTFNGYNDYDFRRLFREAMFEEKNYSEDYKNMSPAAKNLWNFMVALNQRAIKSGYLKDRGLSFFPLVEASAIQRLMQTNSLIGEAKDLFKDGYTVKINETQGYSKIDSETGQIERTIPKFFTRTDKDVSQLSKDLTNVGTLWIKALLEYESARDMENTLLTLHSVEKAKGHILVDENQEIIFESGVPKIDERTNKNADILETIIDDAVYGMKENLSSIGNIGISKLSEKISGDEETKEQRKLNIKKGLNNANKLTQSLAVGLKALVALPNYFGYHLQTFINSGNLYKYQEFLKNHGMITTGIGLTEIDKGLIDEFVPLNEDITKEKRRELAKKQSYTKWLASWNFTDVMMITNAFPEKKLQLTNAKSIIDNSMVVDGKIVSIRQHLKAIDRKVKKGMSASERKQLENSFENRVEELKKTKSLPNIAKIENDLVVIPNVSEEELAKFRTKIVEYSRNLNGQMSDVNKADYRRDTILKSFMMFKNWIPKQIGLRTLDIRKNPELDEWEYGRTRLFVKTWQQLGFTGIFKMRQIILGTDEGIAIMNQMLDDKKEAYYRKTGQTLEITNEEFYDMVRKELSNQMKEIGLLLGLMTTIIAAKAAVPPEDADDLEKNRYKWWMKLINKTSDEVWFYYNPISFEGMTTGSVIPSLSLLSKVEKVFVNLGKATYATAMEDDELWEKTHTAKYFMDIIPVISQFNKEVLPYIDPELAKELGIRVTEQARR